MGAVRTAGLLANGIERVGPRLSRRREENIPNPETKPPAMESGINFVVIDYTNTVVFTNGAMAHATGHITP
jgi:hypothetical protein